MNEYLPDLTFIPDDILKSFANTVPTPFYVYDQSGIQQSIREIHGWFSWMGGYRNFFPLRENTNPTILRILSQNGTGVKVNNLGELKLALSCGFDGSQILYESTRMDPEAEALALAHKTDWLIDSPALLPETLPEHLILQYHPCDQKLDPVKMKSVGRSKIGFRMEDLLTALYDLQEKGVRSVGLGLEISSYNIRDGVWTNRAKILFRLCAEIFQKTGISIDTCYLGEGPGLPLRPGIKTADPILEAQAVHQLWQELPENQRPVIVTGIAKRLLDPHGLMVTRALEHRHTYRTYLVVDAGMCQFLRPTLKGAYRHISLLGDHRIQGRKYYVVVGESTDEKDFLSKKGRMLPPVNPGDFCVVHGVGCGARSASLLYAHQPVAAEYMYLPDGSFTQISPRREPEEVQAFLITL